MRRLVLLMIVAASLLAMAACNIVKGAGEDVSSAGHAVADTTEHAQH